MAFETGRKKPLNPYSPWKSTPETLQRTLVGRNHTVKDILEKTRRFCDGAPPKHCLLVGRRGLGKTHLLSLIYHFYDKSCTQPGYETISHCVLPVLLLEEERYSLNSLVVSLIKIYQKFSEKFPGEERWGIPGHLEADEDVIEYCLENLKNISKSENKKIIILCDNLEEVFKQWQEKEYKKLRAFLSDQDAVMIIGTAVKIFKEIIHPQEPFYEFFEPVPLYDLTDSQMLELLKKRFIDDNLEEEFNRKEKHLKGKVAAIAKLTGGNPRLVVFLYDIVTKKNMFEVEDAARELMESLNEYFRNRFTDLAPQEKTILDAFAEMEGPATPKEIAKKTRIKEQSTYAHIKNLKDAGFIEIVEFGKHKISRYDVTERLFRLWRQNATISGNRRFRVLIKLLKLYFTPEELKEDFQRSIKQLDDAFAQTKWKVFEEHLHYLSYLQCAAEGSLKFEIFDKMTDFLLKKGDYQKVEDEIKAFTSEIEVDKKNSDLKLVYKKLLHTHLKQERYVDASQDIFQLVEYPISEEKEEYLKILDKIIDECPDDYRAWISKGKILVYAGDYDEVLQTFQKASDLNPEQAIYYNIQAFFLRQLNRLKEALKQIEKAIELDGNNASYWEQKGLIVGNLEKYEDALRAFQKASELNPEKPEYYRLQSVALRYLDRSKEALPLIEKSIELNGNNDSYWEEKGILFYILDKDEDALQAFQKASELNPEEPDYYLQQSRVLRYLNRSKEALPLIEKSIELNGNNDSYWEEKGILFYIMDKDEDALHAFQKASELSPEEPDYYLQQSRALRSLNRSKEALPLIEKSIELNGNNDSYWEEKGLLFYILDKDEDALQAFQKASELSPEEPDYYLRQSSTLRSLNRSKEALPLIEKAIELNGNNASYWDEKGLLFGILEKYEEALQAFQKASELNPEEPDYYFGQSLALRSLNRSKEALPLIEKSIELNGNKDSYWDEKGILFYILDKDEDALQAFQKASELNPEEPDYYLRQSRALRYLDRSKEALPLIEKAIELNGNKDSYWEEKGILFGILEKYEEALQAFQKASELNPEEPDYYLRQSRVLRYLDRSKEALSLIEKAIELNGNNDSYWGEKGIIFYILDKDEEALQAFQKASELNPEEPDYYLRQSRALRSLKRSKEALPLIEKAIELNGTKDSYWEEKGILFYILDKDEDALQAFQKASELNPEEPDYYLRQSRALRSLNRSKEALPLIEKAIELDGKNLSYWKEKAEILAELGKHKEGIKCFRESIELNPENIDHKIVFLGFLIFYVKDLKEAGNYLEEIEKKLYDQVGDNPDYLHYKSDYLILTCQFGVALPWVEKRLKKEPNDLDTRVTHFIIKACLGEFGEQMEGLPGKIIKENLEEYQIIEFTQFIYRIMEACLSNHDTQRANGLFLVLLKLKEWHKINEVQEVIALYLRQLVDFKNRDLFVNAVNSAREHITDKDLLELLKAFLYAGKYLQEGNKVILEEVFPEIREIILDMIEKFEEN